jgi:hypothetical protein
MPSEPLQTIASHEGPRSRWAWLWSQGLGVLCGQATVLLLALGSILLAATRDGASARIAMDDLRGFFVAPSPVHVWLYLLLPVLGLYGLNTFLATWRNVVRQWRNGRRMPRAYAAPVIHLAFLTGLLAHLVGGLWGGEQGPLLVGPAWQDLEDGREARVTALEIEHLPDGGLKQVRATLEVREPGGDVSEPTVSYNGPLSSGLGSDLFLLARAVSVPGAARLSREGADRCQLEVEATCDLGGIQARLLYLHPPARRGGAALARVRLRASPRGSTEDLWLTQGQPHRLPDGTRLTLEGIDPRPAILLGRRHAPGNPWALLASILLLLGLGMMWRRFV